MSFVARVKAQEVKILTLDIETKPLLSYHWRLFKETIGISQIVEHGGLLCFAGKWVGQPKAEFYAEWEDGVDVVGEAHRMLSEADIVVSYNGDRFDLKTLNHLFAEAKLGPVRPYKSVDLYKENKANFNFPSRKLDYMAQRLVNDHKTQHTGFQLWLDCMAGDPKAQALMKKYNIQDVNLTERLYLENLAWWKYQPHMGMFLESRRDVCPHCGSEKLRQDDGHTVKAVATTYYLRSCEECGGWSRTTERGREHDKLYTRRTA